MNPYNFKKEDLYKFKEAFNIFDIRQSGAINQEDLPALLSVLHVSLSNKKIKEMQETYCTNKKMKFRDFQGLMNELKGKKDSEEELLNSFENIQEEFSLEMSIEHLKKLLMKHGEPFSSEEMDMFLAETDPDKTGTINYREVVKTIMK